MKQPTPHGASDPVEERVPFDVAPFAGELERAASNHDLGTSLLFENEHVRVFEVRLEPKQRGPFHIHDRAYFWTVVESGTGLQRSDEGTQIVHNYRLGETRYLTPSVEAPLIHDLENVGDSVLRFVTVELKH